jgi:hypothetical protein
MTSDAGSYPTTLVTSLSAKAALIPQWMEPFEPVAVDRGQLEDLKKLRDVTLVLAKSLDSLLTRRNEGFLDTLASLMARTRPAKIVFLLQSEALQLETRRLERQLQELFEHFPRPSDLELALRDENGLSTVLEAFAKLTADPGRARERSRRSTSSRVSEPDPLGSLQGIIEVTQDLRAGSGKLSAMRIAEAFGLPLAELARILGRSRQSVSKTDDADSLQAPLRPFEKVARIRALLSPEGFRTWLHLANDQLQGESPLEWIRKGRVDVIADLAADVLTGAPS